MTDADERTERIAARSATIAVLDTSTSAGRAAIDTDSLTWAATDALLSLDARFIGTPDYMGMAYFWAYEYRYPMRGASYGERRRVHAALLAAGLAVDGESDAHTAIILATVPR